MSFSPQNHRKHSIPLNKSESEQELTPTEKAIFLELVAEEDPTLHERLSTAYERSLTVEKEVPQIETREELEHFLALVESEGRKHGFLEDPEWEARAHDTYIRDRNRQVIKQQEVLDRATSKIHEGCQKLQEAITDNSSAKNLQQGCLLLIRGSHGLFSLVKKYHYPKQNWLKKILAKKLPLLKYARFRREERIKNIHYILDYLQQYVATAESDLDNLQTSRIQNYLQTLPLEVTHLAEWLVVEIDKQRGIKGN